MENNLDILEDGSVFGKTFSGKNYTGEYPSIKEGDTYKDFYERCEKAKAQGFHLGDLSWGDYHSYCLGFSGNSECRQNEEI